MWRILLLMLGCALCSLQASTPYTTHYPYCRTSLGGIKSTFALSPHALEKWDSALEEYFHKHPTSYFSTLRVYAYLYAAQRDAAFLAYNVQKGFYGSLDPLMQILLHQLVPGFDTPPLIERDTFSDALAQLVAAPYLARMEREQTGDASFALCTGLSPASAEIEAIARWRVWTPPLPTVSPPPAADDHVFWENQLSQLRKEAAAATSEELLLADRWEKSLEWRALLNDFLRSHSPPLELQLEARARLLMALQDTLLAVFRAKYTYCIPRPHLRNPQFSARFAPSATPSYPSGHAAEAGAAAIVLSHLFPQHALLWQRYAHEESQSRLWAGVHYPIDCTAGFTLGSTIGHSINTVPSL